jgi:hypothetical protein
MPPPSHIWALPVSLFAMCATGCVQPRDPNVRLADRASQAIEDLERLKPRLAKTGTPDAELLADQLAAVRGGLVALPTDPPPPPAPSTDPPPVPALVRCPDEGCWRLGVQVESGMWHLDLRGGGGELTESGPLAFGLAIAAERSRPIDHRLEWSWGGELVASQQLRDGGQHVTLIGLRPLVRAALAVHDAIAITARPIVEFGQAYTRLGAPPYEVLDRSDVYASLGARVGTRVKLALGGDLTAEIGYRQTWFHGSAGTTDYRIVINSPEAAIGWAASF